MKKEYLVLVFLLVFLTFSLSAEYTVGDVRQHGGWYSIIFEINPQGNDRLHVTQCYPSGDELAIIGDEREGLPLYLKVLCLGILEQSRGNFNFNQLTFEEEGLFFQLASFSLTFTLRITMSEEELLASLGVPMVNRYRDMRWP